MKTELKIVKKKKAKKNCLSSIITAEQIKLHLLMLAKPLIVAIIFTAPWPWMQEHGWHFRQKCEGIMTAGIIPSVVVLSAVLAGLTMNTIWLQFDKTSEAILCKDLKSFMIVKDKRIPVLVHVILATFSLAIIVLVMLLDWEGCIWEGAVAVFITAFSLALYAAVAIELDSPTEGLWVAGKVPKEWEGHTDYSICWVTTTTTTTETTATPVHKPA